MAEIMFKILKQKKEITLEDILIQFEISAATAYNVQRALKALCQKSDECEVVIKSRRTVFVWHSSKELQEKVEEDEEEEIDKIMDAEPAQNQ